MPLTNRFEVDREPCSAKGTEKGLRIVNHELPEPVWV